MTELTERLREALASRYRIERELGQGGMATVYLAEDLKHHRPVAIKVLEPEIATVLGPERFLGEIQTAAGLQHPHILALLDSGAAAGLLYYVMPYAKGESLRERLEREKQLPVETGLKLAQEVADALDYAHRHGIVHRDIKPGNILFQDGHAVVADFGIARAIGLAGGARLTGTGTVVGTPAYMSPEQAVGGRDVDARSDVYSLACVVYEMLAGEPPFTGPTGEVLVHQHLTLEPRPVTALRPAVPATIARALTKALAKAPADRFETAARFAEALAPREPAAVTSGPTVAIGRPARWGWGRIALLGGAAAVAVVAGALLITRLGRKAPTPAGPAHERSAIAVLPFQNLSAGPDVYFAGGLHDELLTQLSKVAALKVISRTSVMGYQGTSKPLKQIAGELGVGSVVEGSVQVAGGRLRVNVQLIDAATDEHLWAESYNRTLDDAFAIQSDVAQQIVVAVGAALTRAEQASITEAPTRNAEAYRLYLQGREYWNRPGYLRQDTETAQKLYERALTLDPNFALAHAELSQIHGWMYWSTDDPLPARAERQRVEAETALRLAPDLPQAHIAMGLVHYWGRRAYRPALEEFAIALKQLPNDAELWDWIGSVHRRLGNWDEVFAAYEKAAELNPRRADTFYDLGGQSYQFVRRYADAVRAYERALTLAPDLRDAATGRAWTYFEWEGHLDTVRAVLRRLPGGAQPAERYILLFYERKADSLLHLQQTEHIELVSQDSYLPTALLTAWAHRLRGDHAAARVAYGSAVARLDFVLRKLPDDWRVHSARGFALAGLGRRGEALREARWLRQSAIYREDAFMGRGLAQDRALILAHAGDTEAALDELEGLLARPSSLNVHWLRLDPLWDPIRAHPRFKALLAKYGSRAAR